MKFNPSILFAESIASTTEILVCALVALPGDRCGVS